MDKKIEKRLESLEKETLIEKLNLELAKFEVNNRNKAAAIEFEFKDDILINTITKTNYSPKYIKSKVNQLFRDENIKVKTIMSRFEEGKKYPFHKSSFDKHTAIDGIVTLFPGDYYWESSNECTQSLRQTLRVKKFKNDTKDCAGTSSIAVVWVEVVE